MIPNSCIPSDLTLQRNIIEVRLKDALMCDDNGEKNQKIGAIFKNVNFKKHDIVGILAEIAQPNVVAITPQKTGCLSCKICGHKFPKGESGWKGNKRFCKRECKITDLVPDV